MTTPSSQQPTSSADSATPMDKYLNCLPEDFMFGDSLHAGDLMHIVDAARSSAIVPQVAQAPTNEAVDIAAKVFKSLFFNAGHDGETTNEQMRRAMRAAMISSGYVAAPKVATVPSDLAEIIKIEARDLHHKLVGDFNMDDDAGSNWLARGYITGAIESCVKAAAPSTAEQASDVRNAAIEECATLAFEEVYDLPIEDTYTAKRGFSIEVRDAILALKSATPADKGNPPAEAKS